MSFTRPIPPTPPTNSYGNYPQLPAQMHSLGQSAQNVRNSNTTGTLPSSKYDYLLFLGAVCVIIFIMWLFHKITKSSSSPSLSTKRTSSSRRSSKDDDDLVYSEQQQQRMEEERQTLVKEIRGLKEEAETLAERLSNVEVTQKYIEGARQDIAKLKEGLEDHRKFLLGALQLWEENDIYPQVSTFNQSNVNTAGVSSLPQHTGYQKQISQQVGQQVNLSHVAENKNRIGEVSPTKVVRDQ